MNDARPQLLLERKWPLPVGAAATVVLGGVTGCAPSPEPVAVGVVETEHLRITTTEDNPICAGTPLLLEAELARITDVLALPPWSEDEKLDVRFGMDAVAEVCAPIFDGADQSQGCATRGDDGYIVVASSNVGHTASHELVHAVRLENHTWTAIPFEEGLAQLLSASEGFPIYVDYPNGAPVIGPIELLEIPREDFGLGYYLPSQSFVSWLWETRGQPTLMSFVNDPAFSEAADAPRLFEQHFGLPLADAEQAWREDDRPDPIWGAPCSPEHTYSLADGPVEVSGNFDCREPTVHGASYWMSLWPMCLEVPETIRVRIELEAEHGRLSIYRREPCDPGPASAEASQDKYLDAGETIETDIVGCRFQMLLHSQEAGFPATPYSIRIEELEG